MRRASAALFWLLAFVGTLVALHVAARPDPLTSGRDILHQKMAELRSRSDRLDIVFVGNSHVYRSLNIQVFEAELSALGCPASAYNLGVQALTIYEQRAALAALEDLPGGPPRHVVLGPTFRARPQFDDLNDISVSAFYRLPDVPVLLDRWVTTEKLQGRRLLEAAYVYAAAQMPRGALHHRWWDERLELRSEPQFTAAVTTDGYLSLEAETLDRPETAARRATIDDFVESGGFARAIDPERVVAPVDPVSLEQLRARLDGVGSSRPVLLLQPTVFHREMQLLQDAWDEEVPLVNLARPDQVPALLEPQSWFDRTHVTEAVAVEVSRLAAQQICPILDEGAS